MIETSRTTHNKAVDFEKLRAEFPVLQQQVKGKPVVYLDNAASSQMPLPVIERINRYHRAEHSNVHRGVHTLSQQATDAYEEAREKVRAFINAAHKEEVIYTGGTTDSINLVAHSFGEAFFKPGDEVILSQMEHHANIVPWQLIAKKTGLKIKVIPVNDRGELVWEEYLKLLSDRTRLVSVMHVSNALGTINPVKDIVREAHERDVPVLLDGAQAAPHISVDVQELDCDFYAFSSHKMCGPTGIGILYGKKQWLDRMPPYRGGGEMIDKVTFEETTFDVLPHKFEAGTPPIVSGIGLGAAVDYLNDIGMENIAQRERQLLEYAEQRIREAFGEVRIIGEAGEKAAVLSFVLGDIHAHDTGTILDQQGIAIRTGHHCAQPTMQRFGVPATARASFAFYNNEEDINRFIDGLKTVKELLA